MGLIHSLAIKGKQFLSLVPTDDDLMEVCYGYFARSKHPTVEGMVVCERHAALAAHTCWRRTKDLY